MFCCHRSTVSDSCKMLSKRNSREIGTNQGIVRLEGADHGIVRPEGADQRIVRPVGANQRSKAPLIRSQSRPCGLFYSMWNIKFYSKNRKKVL